LLAELFNVKYVDIYVCFSVLYLVILLLRYLSGYYSAWM